MTLLVSFITRKSSHKDVNTKTVEILQLILFEGLKVHNARVTFGIRYPSEMSLQLYHALLHLEGSLNILDFVKDVGEFSLPISMEGNEL